MESVWTPRVLSGWPHRLPVGFYALRKAASSSTGEGITKPYACMLGGPHRRMLFVCTAGSSVSDEARTQASGRIEIVEVNVSGAGLP